VAKAVVSWDNEARTALRFDVQAGCEWSDFWEAVHEAYRLMGGVDHQVDLIIHPAPGAAPPVRALANFKMAQDSHPANQGMLAIVGAGMYAEVLVNTFARIYKRLGEEIVFVSSLDKARAALAARYPLPTADRDSRRV
jgi:hypothetical protein